jgi:phosphoglycolate phosphatase-like HAD superfamily hydrolase
MTAKTKSKKEKDATKPIKDLLPKIEDLDNEPTFQLSALFQFKELKLKDDMQWRIKLVVKEQLPQTFREYEAAMSFNEEPWDVKVEDLEKRKVAIADEDTLFPDQKQKQIRECDLAIGDVRRDMEKARKDVPTMEFKAIVEALAYKDGDTVLTMIVSSDVVGELNTNRHILKFYKLDLIRE